MHVQLHVSITILQWLVLCTQTSTSAFLFIHGCRINLSGSNQLSLVLDQSTRAHEGWQLPSYYYSFAFCSAALCDDPVDIRNGIVTFNGGSIGDMAAYTCNSGFELIGNATRTCTLVDINSAEFQPVQPSCRREYSGKKDMSWNGYGSLLFMCEPQQYVLILNSHEYICMGQCRVENECLPITRIVQLCLCI